MTDECRGFQWLGQDFAHCDGCGRDLRDHEGLLSFAPGTSPFSGEDIVIPFDEARERIPMFGHYVTPIDRPEGPYRYEPRTPPGA